MENASKALIMAGSILIALMILGALVLMFSNLTNYQKTDTETTRTAQVTEFNNQFETYNRDNVRGSELYSLLNRVIDYNRRKSLEGTGATDTGQDISYAPMTVTFSIDNKELAANGTNNLLIKNSNYTISKTDNTFEKEIKGTIDTLENKYGQDSLTNLTTNLTKIFVDVAPEEGSNEEKIIVENFNAASKVIKIESFKDIKSGSTIRKEIYTYYEYIQFKRAYFDCESVEYDKDTGRITKMDFEFTGKFN